MENKNKKAKLLILISGGGSNMDAVICACAAGQLNAEVAAVVSSNHTAGGLEKAKKHNIPTYVCAKSDFETEAKRDKKIAEIAACLAVDYIVLAGYLGIVTPVLIDKYKDKIINIHPSLLPKFGGKNFFGLNVHRAVLHSGDKISGATVHFVDQNIDTGKIILQATVDVLPADTPDDLQKRVLSIEHSLLISALKTLVE